MTNPTRPAPPRNASSARSSARNWLLAAFNALALVALWLFESRVGEAFWVSGLLCYLPQHWAILPTLALLIWALARRHWKLAGAYLLTLLYATHVFLGLQARASTWASTGAPKLQMRVMSYNIRGGSRGLVPLAREIGQHKPDVLFLQEAVVIAGSNTVDPVVPLHRLLPGYFEARAGEVCIFSRFPILATRQEPFPEGASRFVLEAMLNVRGVPIRVVNVHPYSITFRDRRRSLPRRIAHSMSVRQRQIATLLGVIERPASTWKREWQEAPLLVAGDFNTPPRGRIYSAMAARLGDSWREAGAGLGKTYSADWPLVRIDYVWHSREWTARRAFVPASRASDHRPLVVDLELNHGTAQK